MEREGPRRLNTPLTSGIIWGVRWRGSSGGKSAGRLMIFSPELILAFQSRGKSISLLYDGGVLMRSDTMSGRRADADRCQSACCGIFRGGARMRAGERTERFDTFWTLDAEQAKVCRRRMWFKRWLEATLWVTRAPLWLFHLFPNVNLNVDLF